MKLLKKILTGVLALTMALTAVPAVSASAAADSSSKLIAFTFDDGPSQYTSALLDGLKERGAKATFFMAGSNGIHGINNYSDVLTRMWEEGHELANHTYSHKTPFNKLSAETAVSEVKKVESLIFKATGGKYQELVRIPGGARGTVIEENVSAPLIIWSVDTLDWKYRNADTVYNNIIKSAKDGSIVLMHDIYSTSVQGALRAIDTLKKQGYEFVTVAELMRRKGVELQNGAYYYSASDSSTKCAAYSAPAVTCSYTADTAKLSVSSADTGLKYYYTTDGSYPNLGSSRFGKTVTAKKNTTYTVIGVDKYGTRTPVTTCTVRMDPVEAGGKVFYDIVQDGWYYEGVNYAVRNGIMNGTADFQFSPSKELTKAGMLAALWNLAGKPEPTVSNPYSDVSEDDWYYSSALWAYEAGITVNAEKFGGNDKVAFQNVALYLARYADYAGKSMTAEDNALSAYHDSSKIASYAVSSMKKCVSEGIISGSASMNLNPTIYITRAQTATVLMKLEMYLNQE